MVEVFREVRRVLRPDGTCWVNMGDGYCGGGRGCEGKGWEQGAEVKGRILPSIIPPGLKPKDLCLIPFRLAIALQEPYYTGKIKDVADRIWLAAMIDGEGCIFIHKRKTGQPNGQGYFRKNDSYSAGLEVANVHESIIQRCMDITGIGSICRVERETKHKQRNIPLYRWNLRSNQCREIVKEIYPYLVGKQHEARLLLSCPSSGIGAEKAHYSLMALHNGRQATIDFPAPASCTEPGWFVRSDIIWSKKNPMPESVTDRPTKSHEYVFLLSKSEKYFYDAEAVREEEISPGRSAKEIERQVRLRANKDNIGRKPIGVSDSVGTWKGDGSSYHSGRNRRSVWTIATQPFPDAHFATFPEKLVEPCVLAGTSSRGCCPKCGAQWVRVVEKEGETTTEKRKRCDYSDKRGAGGAMVKQNLDYAGSHGSNIRSSATLGFRPSCDCMPSDGEPGRRELLPEDFNPEIGRWVYSPIPCSVLDPFAGSGTTALVAERLGRNSIMIELKEEYVEMIKKRTRQWNLI